MGVRRFINRILGGGDNDVAITVVNEEGEVTQVASSVNDDAEIVQVAGDGNFKITQIAKSTGGGRIYQSGGDMHFH